MLTFCCHNLNLEGSCTKNFLEGSCTTKMFVHFVCVLFVAHQEQEVVELLGVHTACVILTLYPGVDMEAGRNPCNVLVCYRNLVICFPSYCAGTF